jgi:hypothetical protein
LAVSSAFGVGSVTVVWLVAGTVVGVSAFGVTVAAGRGGAAGAVVGADGALLVVVMSVADGAAGVVFVGAAGATSCFGAGRAPLADGGRTDLISNFGSGAAGAVVAGVAAVVAVSEGVVVVGAVDGTVDDVLGCVPLERSVVDSFGAGASLGVGVAGGRFGGVSAGKASTSTTTPLRNTTRCCAKNMISRLPAVIWLFGSPRRVRTWSRVAPINDGAGSAARAVARSRATATPHALKPTANEDGISQGSALRQAVAHSNSELVGHSSAHRAGG